MLSHLDSIMRRHHVALGRSFYDHVPTIIDGVPFIRDLADSDLTRSRDLADDHSSSEDSNEGLAHTYIVDPISNDDHTLARTFVITDAVSSEEVSFIRDPPDAVAEQTLPLSTDCVAFNRDLADARTEVIAPVQRTSTFRDGPVDVSAYFARQWEKEEEVRRVGARHHHIRPTVVKEQPQVYLIDDVVDTPENIAYGTIKAKKTPRPTPRFLHQCRACSLHPSSVTTVCGHLLCKECARRMRASAHCSWIACPICRMAWRSVEPSVVDQSEDTVSDSTVPKDTVADIDWERTQTEIMEFEEIPKSAFSQHHRRSLIGRMSIRVRKMLK